MKKKDNESKSNDSETLAEQGEKEYNNDELLGEFIKNHNNNEKEDEEKDKYLYFTAKVANREKKYVNKKKEIEKLDIAAILGKNNYIYDNNDSKDNMIIEENESKENNDSGYNIITEKSESIKNNDSKDNMIIEENEIIKNYDIDCNDIDDIETIMWEDYDTEEIEKGIDIIEKIYKENSCEINNDIYYNKLNNSIGEDFYNFFKCDKENILKQSWNNIAKTIDNIIEFEKKYKNNGKNENKLTCLDLMKLSLVNIKRVIIKVLNGGEKYKYDNRDDFKYHLEQFKLFKSAFESFYETYKDNYAMGFISWREKKDERKKTVFFSDEIKQKIGNEAWNEYIQQCKKKGGLINYRDIKETYDIKSKDTSGNLSDKTKDKFNKLNKLEQNLLAMYDNDFKPLLHNEQYTTNIEKQTLLYK